MDSKLHELTLPPQKRYKLFQQENNDKSPATPYLPAKNRKLSESPPSLPLTLSYCLPAKKRIWALHPFDLNLQPETEQPIENQKFPEKTNQITNNTIVTDVEDDDGIVCDICKSTDGDSDDPIVLCDGCDVMVHCTCYGHPLTKGVPEGEWFCSHCLGSNSTNLKKRCCLCPGSGGAMKATVDGKWAHIVCALFVPEVFFYDPEGREGIDCSKVPRRRFEGECYLCGCRRGCVVDCSEDKCGLGFHVTCGLNEDLCFEYQQGKNRSDVVAGFCRKHTDLWQKQQQTGKFKIVARD